MVEEKNNTDILGYTLVNNEKLNRAIFGMIGPRGSLMGGVGENASDMEKIAEYDRLGGLILKGERKVKTGSFYNFTKKTPREKPEVLLVFTDIAGNTVELGEEEPIPMEVKAAQMIKEQKTKAATKTVTKKPKKADDEDEE
jgi:hypothetical protein